MLGKIDSYQLSTIYTAVAFIANSVYEVYLHQYELAEEPLSRDIILVSIYAAVVSYILSLIKTRRTRVIASVTSTMMWLLRLACGVIISSYMGLLERDVASIVYWVVSFLGATFGGWSMITQYREHKEHKEYKAKELEPVKLRFVA